MTADQNRLLGEHCSATQDISQRHHHTMTSFPPPYNGFSRSSTSFSIDDILRANFGRRRRHDDSLTSSVTSSLSRSDLVNISDDDKRSASNDIEHVSAVCNIGTDKCHWPAWVYCTRYTDRPAGMPVRRKRSKSTRRSSSSLLLSRRRSRASFTPAQLAHLSAEYLSSTYLTPARRTALAAQLAVTELQIKVWFQNQRAKNKRSARTRSVSSSADSIN